MQKENLSRAVKYIESWMDFNFPHSRIPGLVVAIQQGDEIVFEKAYGFANLEKKTPMKTGTIFRIASHSKMFTTVALLQLAEQKKIIITKPIVTYLPWLAQAKDARYAKITVQQILQHGAGIVRDGEDSDFWNLTRPFPGKEKLKKEFLDTPLVFDPNKQFKYSNYGFSLLGFLIEEVSGVSYAEYIQKHILDPLSMRHSGAGIDFVKDFKHFATGYSREDAKGKRKPFKNVSTNAMASATGLYATAADLCKFSRIFYEQNKVLSKKALQQMSTVKWDTSDEKKKASLYGMGSTQVKIGNRYYFGHSGGFPGFITHTAIDTKQKISIIVLTNAIDGEAWTIRAQAAKLLQLFEKQTYSTKIKERDAFEGRYEDIWEVVDIINTTHGLVANEPFKWGVSSPLVEYRHVSKNTFELSKANGFYGVGEKVNFIPGKKGKIQKVIHAGYTLKRTA